MEKLLNKLIKKGWKPFGFRGEETRIEIERNKDLDMQIFKLDWIIIEQHHRISGSLRNLVSKESGLWQFVCENGMVKMKEGFYWQNIFPLDSQEYDYTDYQYWILESSLIDEDKLEKFLLDNIKI